MRFVTILPSERGVLWRRGLPVRWLEPGSHVVWGTVTRYPLSQGAVPWSAELSTIVPHDAAQRVDIPARHHGLLTVDGLPSACLDPGRWLLWTLRSECSLQVVDTTDITTPIPPAFVDHIPAALRRSVVGTDDRRGLLQQNGRLVGLLPPGEHWLWWQGQGNAVTWVHLMWMAWTPQLQAILGPDDADILDVAVGQLALVSCDGMPCTVLTPGRYVLWQLHHRVTATLHDASVVHTTIPQQWWSLIPVGQLQVTTVRAHQQALLYIDGVLHEVLSPGRLGVHTIDRDVRIEIIDLWEQELQIAGQEVMTADKVSLRINIILRFQVTDPVRATEGTQSVREALYSEAQMTARRHIAGVTVDELLEKRQVARAAMLAELSDRAEALGVSIAGIDLKDVILPGEMKAIFNQVIAAQKQAAANVITRREETAATRSLANTARMLENNPTLLKLKELEVLKDMASQVGELTVVATPDQLLQSMGLRK